MARIARALAGTQRSTLGQDAHIFWRPTLAQGTIKKLTDKGFGFIASGGQEIFFHQSALENARYDDLREGDTVEYTEGQGPKGPRAENVTLVD